MSELKMTYVVYLIDIDPDTGFVSQMLPVAYLDNEHIAEFITIEMNENPDEDAPNRTYKYTKLS